MRNRSAFLVMFVVLIGVAIGGCGPVKKDPSKPAPKPASSAMVAQIREDYARAYPESRVGVVIAARPQDMLVAVGDVKGADFRENQIVTFIDSDQQLLTTGSVARVLDESIHVRYAQPERGGRAPLVGDIMVKTPIGSGTL